MNKTIKIKMLVDIVMSIALLGCMSYLLIGEELHEWIGTFLIILFIIHHILNRNWYPQIFRKPYTPIRILQLLINICMGLSMLGLIISSVILSRYVFSFLPIQGSVSFARVLHMVSAYWGFVLMAAHIGLHWGIILGFIRKGMKLKTSKPVRWGLCIVAFLIAIYGGYCFMKYDLLSYMLVENQFVFFDVNQPLLLFLIDYIAIMGLFIWIFYYIYQILIKLKQSKRRE